MKARLTLANIVYGFFRLVFCLLLGYSLAGAQASWAADKLEITDEYLQGLSEEVSSPEYITKAKEELRKSEVREKSEQIPNKQVARALTTIGSFEALIKTEHPASYKIYSELSAQSKETVFKRFNSTKKLSSAKRLIIELYLNL